MRATCPKCLPRLLHPRTIRTPILATREHPETETGHTKSPRPEPHLSTSPSFAPNAPSTSRTRAPHRVEASSLISWPEIEVGPAAKLEPESEIAAKPTSSVSGWTVGVLSQDKHRIPQLNQSFRILVSLLLSCNDCSSDTPISAVRRLANGLFCSACFVDRMSSCEMRWVEASMSPPSLSNRARVP